MQTNKSEYAVNTDDLPDRAEFKRLLDEIKEEAERLRGAFLTESEHQERLDAIELYDNKIQEMLVGTRLHLELYRTSGWRSLIYGE